MKKLCYILIILFTISAIQPVFSAAKAADKTIVAASAEGGILYTRPYDLKYAASAEFIEDLVYPQAYLTLRAEVTIPGKTKLRKEVADYLNNIFRKNVPEFEVLSWAPAYLESCFKNFEEKTLVKAGEQFKKTSADNAANYKIREAEVKKINQEFVTILKNIEKNKFLTDMQKKIKTLIINDLKNNLKTTILGLDVVFTLIINGERSPNEKKGLLNKLANSNKSRDAFFANSPKFAVNKPADRSANFRIPNIIYFDFPCPYFDFPETPDYKALAEMPANLGNDAFFFVHHQMPLRELRTMIDQFNTDTAAKSNSTIFDCFFNHAEKYAEQIFTGNDITDPEYQKLNQKLQEDIIAKKGKLSQQTKNAISPYIKTAISKAKVELSFIEDLNRGYKIPYVGTQIKFAAPDSIDQLVVTDTDVVAESLEKLSQDVTQLSTSLNNWIATINNAGNDFYQFVKLHKPVKNADFQNFLKDKELRKHLNAISLKDSKHAANFSNDLLKLSQIMDEAKELWVISDIITYNPEMEMLVHKGKQLKKLLVKIMPLYHFFSSTRVYCHDMNIDLETRLKNLCIKNNGTETQAYDYLLQWAYSVQGSFSELKKFPESNAKTFSSAVKQFIDFGIDKPIKIFSASNLVLFYGDEIENQKQKVK